MREVNAWVNVMAMKNRTNRTANISFFWVPLPKKRRVTRKTIKRKRIYAMPCGPKYC
jgi:hypothetical protein